MKSRQRIIIGLHTDCVRVSVVRQGKIVVQSTSWIEEPASHDAWEDGLHAFDVPLRRALKNAGITSNCLAEVVYESPTAAVGASATKAAGVQTALLELEARGAVDLTVQPHASWVVGTSDANESLAVAVTDSPLTLDTLMRWVERAGLTMKLGVPIEAVGVGGALTLHASSIECGPRVTAFLGDWCSGVVVASDEGVRFVRSSPLNGDALAHAMAGIDEGVDTLLPDRALDLLHAHGLPDTDTPPVPNGVNAHEARAAIQPLLQRAAVDLRQSMRFGLAKDDADRVVLHAGGEATKIVGLVPLVAEMLGIERVSAGSSREISNVLTALDRLGLVPDERLDQTKSSRLRKALWIGTAAALGVSAAQWFIATDEASMAQASLSQLQSGASGMELLDERRQRVEAHEQLLTHVNRAVAYSAEFGPRWPGWLVDLAERCPERIVVLGMSGTRSENDVGNVTLNGVVLPEGFGDEPIATADAAEDANPEDGTHVLRSLIASLEESPLVEDVELGSTRRGTAMGEGSTSFALTVRLRSAPAVAEVDDE